jgi:hypothetical protein
MDGCAGVGEAEQRRMVRMYEKCGPGQAKIGRLGAIDADAPRRQQIAQALCSSDRRRARPCSTEGHAPELAGEDVAGRAGEDEDYVERIVT